MSTETFDIIVLGGGSGGLVVASVAGQLGYKVALLEGGRMGGDCLNYGCIPSKALIAAAKMAYMPEISDQFGIKLDRQVDFKKVMTHVKGVIAGIAPHDSVERFTELGATVIEEFGKFADANSVITPSGRKLTAKRIVIATGSRPATPPIKGLNEIEYLTNENIFDLDVLPSHLAVIGGGPIGIEMAQSFRRLGSQITVFEGGKNILAHDNPALANQLLEILKKERISFHLNLFVKEISKIDDMLNVNFEENGLSKNIPVSHVLIAAGRTPNVDKLDLEKAGIEFDLRTGIKVDKTLRTSNKNVYAVGDVAGPFQFTHMAGEQAGIFIKRVLFGSIFTKFKGFPVPWVTYTSPEMAHTGMSLPEAKKQHGEANIKVTTVPVGEVDRNRAERKTSGEIQVITTKKGKVLGVDILADAAGEILPIWTMMIGRGMKLSALSSVIHPYPTFSEINKKVVSAFYKNTLYSAKTSKISKILFKLFG